MRDGAYSAAQTEFEAGHLLRRMHMEDLPVDSVGGEFLCTHYTHTIRSRYSSSVKARLLTTLLGADLSEPTQTARPAATVDQLSYGDQAHTRANDGGHDQLSHGEAAHQRAVQLWKPAGTFLFFSSAQQFSRALIRFALESRTVLD